ncbi:MAG: hypothetical protein Q4C66_05350 [Lachnospiraceae bacterium]|nr:hypothetical protein [Lachnospiraceae bacterium]
MAVSSSNRTNPDDALHELMTQETIINVAVDVQALLRILVEKEIITREEVKEYREEVRNSPKYGPVIEDIQRQRKAFQIAKDIPEAYLKAMFKAKMNGDIW